jgi:putative CocE/NonD family hydrolase
VSCTLWNQRVRARDGVELAANVLLPEGPAPFPTVVIRTPYMRGRPLSNPRGWIRLLEHGYGLVIVDVRGRGDSGGEWIPSIRDSNDGYDVIEWAAAQPWSSGKIGMVSGSYEGLTQWWAAASRPPHLRCIAPLCIGAVQRTLPFGSGIPMQYELWWMSLVLGKTFQYSGAPAWEALMDHRPLKSLDERLGLRRSAWQEYAAGRIDFSAAAATLSPAEFAKIDIPVLIGVGWWDDQNAMLTWEALQGATSSKDCRLLIGAWDHGGNTAPRATLGGIDVSASVMDTIGYVEQFLALHLKGERSGLADSPRCRLFLTGANCWEEMDRWPPPRTAWQSYYLASQGDARSLRGNGRLASERAAFEGSDRYVYDPNRATRDMSNLAMFAWSDLPLDTRYLQRRDDVLVYTSEPLQQALKVSGRWQVRIFMSSDRPDTDLCVALSDVHPDGRAIGMPATLEPFAALRLRYRNGRIEEPMHPGKIYEVTIDGSWVHHLFKVGHRIRLLITSGNFPSMTRNAGSGEAWAEDEVLYPQANTIHHSPRHPSRLHLPIMRGH